MAATTWRTSPPMPRALGRPWCRLFGHQTATVNVTLGSHVLERLRSCRRCGASTKDRP